MVTFIQLPEMHESISEVRIVRSPLPADLNEMNKAQIKRLIKELTELVTDTKIEVTWLDFVRTWNAACESNKQWRSITEKNADIKRRFQTASKHFPKVNDWELIVKGMEAHDFFSGRSGKYDRPKPLTLFMDRRYFEFHEAGKESLALPKKETVDDILSEFRDILAGAQ